MWKSQFEFVLFVSNVLRIFTASIIYGNFGVKTDHNEIMYYKENYYF